MKSPGAGDVDIMRRTRANYLYPIRKIKINSIVLRKNAMAISIINNNSRDLWTETKS